MISVSWCAVNDTIIENKSSRLWVALLALLPACVGCGAVPRAIPDGFCAGCMERSRDLVEDELELGGEG